jgi:hypothetical protein
MPRLICAIFCGSAGQVTGCAIGDPFSRLGGCMLTALASAASGFAATMLSAAQTVAAHGMAMTAHNASSATHSLFFVSIPLPHRLPDEPR